MLKKNTQSEGLKPQAITIAERREMKKWWSLDSYFLYIKRSNWNESAGAFTDWEYSREIDRGRVKEMLKKAFASPVPKFAFQMAAIVLAILSNKKGLPLVAGVIGFDNSSNEGSAPDVTSLSYTSHSVAGSNRVAIANLGHHENVSTDNATFNGSAMTSIGTVGPGGGGGQARIWRQIAPATGAHTVSVGTAGTGGPATSSFFTFTGADQTQSGAATGSNTGNSTSPSASITMTQAAAMLLATCFSRDAAGTVTITPGEGTQTSDKRVTNAGQNSSYRLPGATGSTSSTFTLSAGNQWWVFNTEIMAVAGSNYSQPLSETVTVVDTLGKSTTRLLSEVVTVVDTLSKGAGKVLAEVVTVVDTFARVWNAVRSYTESITIVDTIAKGASRALSETVTLVDSIAKNTTRAFSEALTLVETFVTSRGQYLSLSEVVTIADSISKGASRAFSEAVSIVDSISRSISRSLSQTVSIVDTISKGTTRALSEAVSVVDSIAKSVTRGLSETVSVADSIAKGAGKAFSEGVTITDSISRAITAALSETIAVSDSLAKSTSRAFSEAISVVDSLSASAVQIIRSIGNFIIKSLYGLMATPKQQTLEFTVRGTQRSYTLRNNRIET